MIMNAAIREILRCNPGDEILVANSEEYFNGTPHYSDICDIIKDNDKLIILTK